MKTLERKEDNNLFKALSALRSVPRKCYYRAVSEREFNKEKTHL
jgi:hypothetical protein